MWGTGDPVTISAEVYAVMRRRILRGDLPMGEPISRRRIAADLSTSLQTVTAALLRLESEGLLEHRARAGTRVPIPSADDIRGHYVVLEALEVQAAMRFAEGATRRERVEVEKLAGRVDDLAVAGDRQAFAAAHQRLHLRIAECGHNAVLYQATDRTYAVASVWMVGLRHAPPFDTSTRHAEFVNALVSADAAGAAQAVREHVAIDLQRALELVDRYGRGRRSFRNASRPRASAQP